MKHFGKKIKELIIRKKQLILYLLFGVVTTVCSLLAWYLTMHMGVFVLHDENGDPTALLDVLGSTSQWVVGVVVAFITNKLWVFSDAARGVRATFRQFGIFCSSRVLTYFLEVGINLGMIALLDDLLHYSTFGIDAFGGHFDLTSRLLAKVVSSILVVIINYFISKLIVFRKKGEKDKKE